MLLTCCGDFRISVDAVAVFCYCSHAGANTPELPEAVFSTAPKTDGSPWDGNLFATWQDRAGAHQRFPSVATHLE